MNSPSSQCSISTTTSDAQNETFHTPVIVKLQTPERDNSVTKQLVLIEYELITFFFY